MKTRESSSLNDPQQKLQHEAARVAAFLLSFAPLPLGEGWVRERSFSALRFAPSPLAPLPKGEGKNR